MNLRDVKTDDDWEEYLYRKSMATHEQLRAEMGMGPRAWTLPVPDDEKWAGWWFFDDEDD